ncbi:unnamed protein product [Dovyalis caffra]|uniref:ABC transporter domain-containing protein n=1 Tax=Dovyalis caffra TaxID=77055 RepID=A0AAV1QVD7_9ROSI|nr:unnamed protein product [Dovyalis caffra]
MKQRCLLDDKTSWINSTTISSHQYLPPPPAGHPKLLNPLRPVVRIHLGGTNVKVPQSIPVVLSFNNLTCSVKVRPKFRVALPRCRFQRIVDVAAMHLQVGGESSLKTTKTLNDTSGEARSGESLAVLGASGSGKSTLIDALANRIAEGSLKGKKTLNGRVLKSRMLKAISTYIMQDDVLFPMPTVEETLMNAARTIIGDEKHRGVSGEERRRVSTGIDIIHDPIIVFLNEPTTGLDSTSACMAVKVLERIAKRGSIVIISILRPSYRILGLLDRLILLSRGQTVYSGSPRNLSLFFADSGYPTPENENQAEFALDLVREFEESPGGTESLVEFNKLWQNLMRSRNGADEQDLHGLSPKEAISASVCKGQLVSDAVHNDAIISNSMLPTYANPFWKEVAVLSKRLFTNSLRMPKLFGIRLATVILLGFVLGTMFWQLDNSPMGVEERLGFISFPMVTAFFLCGDVIPVFLQQRNIFMRETAHDTYRRSSYVISRALRFVTTRWAVGLDGGLPGFLFYFLMNFASFWAGSSLVTFLSGVVAQVIAGYIIVVALSAYFNLFGGYFITIDRIFHHLSLVKYPYQAVLQNEVQDPTKCFTRGVQIFYNMGPLK